VNVWKVTAELNGNNDFNACILEAETKEKAIKMAEKYFTKKMKARNIKILTTDLIEEGKYV